MCMDLADILKEWEPQVARSNRASTLQDIISLYRTEQETKLRKLKNIERYKKWLRENRIRRTPETDMKFKKSKYFLKELSDKTICVMLGHVKTPDLDLVYSNCKDLSARGRSVGSYIYSLGFVKGVDK